MSVLSVIGIVVAVVVVLIIIIVLVLAYWIKHHAEVYIVEIIGYNSIEATAAFAKQHNAVPNPSLELLFAYGVAGGSFTVAPPAGPLDSGPAAGASNSIDVKFYGKKPAATTPGVRPFNATQWSQFSGA